MSYWDHYAGAPDMLEQIDYRMPADGGSPMAYRVYAPRLPDIRMDAPLYPMARRPVEEPPPRRVGPAPEDVVAWMDEWYRRDRRPPLPPIQQATGRRGKKRRVGCAEGGLRFWSMRWG